MVMKAPNMSLFFRESKNLETLEKLKSLDFTYFLNLLDRISRIIKAAKPRRKAAAMITKYPMSSRRFGLVSGSL